MMHLLQAAAEKLPVEVSPLVLQIIGTIMVLAALFMGYRRSESETKKFTTFFLIWVIIVAMTGAYMVGAYVLLDPILEMIIKLMQGLPFIGG